MCAAMLMARCAAMSMARYVDGGTDIGADMCIDMLTDVSRQTCVLTRVQICM